MQVQVKDAHDIINTARVWHRGRREGEGCVYPALVGLCAATGKLRKI
jgi:hypothetical protein